jgi:type IV secretory pathway VirB2 component (pilin)
MPNTTEPPAITGPIASTVAASLILVSGLFTTLASPPFACALVIFLAVPIMILCSAYQWLSYIREYVDHRFEQIDPKTEKA